MNRGCLLTAGIIMILIAFALATQTSNQSRSDSPEVARSFATALHTTPSPTPTAWPSATPRPTRSLTATPAPTVTPIPQWTKFQSDGFELWLPEDYGGQLLDFTGTGGEVQAGSGIIHQWLLLYGSNWQPNNFPPTLRSVSILEQWADPALDSGPVSLPDVRLRYPRQSGTPVQLGRYVWMQSHMSVTVSGTVAMKTVYWLKSDDVYWLVAFSVPLKEFDARAAIFEKSMSSFSIVP